MTQTTISEDTWIEEYKPIANPIEPDCGYDCGEGGCLIETYATHVDYLNTFEPEHIWTVLYDDNDNPCIVSGRHFVNRIGYIVTEKPWDHDITVVLD